MSTARLIYGSHNGITAETLYTAYISKQKAPEYIIMKAQTQREKKDICGDCMTGTDAEDAIFPCWRKESEKVWQEDYLLLSYHCQYYLRRMKETMMIAPTEEQVEITEALQEYLMEKISKNGLIVESNPSSNTIIGRMDGILEQPVWRYRLKDSPNKMMTTINTDDPSVFNATLANEHALMYYSLRYHGLGVEEAIKEIGIMRQTAMQYSFIRKDASVKDQIDEYERILYDLIH